MRWTLLEKLLSQLLGFGQGVILARLLSPHDFGLAAMLGLFLAVATTLADTGLGSSDVASSSKNKRTNAPPMAPTSSRASPVN